MPETSKTSYFWFSAESQQQKLRSFNYSCEEKTPPKQNFALIDGRVVPYNIMTSTPENNTNWKDAIYLGEGTWHHEEDLPDPQIKSLPNQKDWPFINLQIRQKEKR